MPTCYLRRAPVPVLFNKIPAILFLLMMAHTATAQSTNISGVVNTYARVIEVIPGKACVRLASMSGIQVNTRVLIIQMKGAGINTANNSSFGDTTALNGAGDYEVGTICSINGDSVFFFHFLLHNYDVNEKVQLVQFGQYYSAVVTDTIKAARWDSVSGTGGVITLYADQDITLQAPIFADSSGYAGGAWFNHNGTCSFLQPAGTGYAYDATSSTNLNGAYKGEGVSDVPTSVDGGKGAPANGGGGGNNHNNSGGGGGNLAAGGTGGGNSSSGPTGCNTANNWGRGGKALSSWNGQKIFMGGGGGAGHANNGALGYNNGGRGGGIIFIWANTINGNGKTISANGGTGGASQSDGAGGGGGGGTIIMNVQNYSGGLLVQAVGGNGGLSDDGLNIGRCFGGGGGGAGGEIYFSGGVPGISFSPAGGVKGNEINRELTCGTAVPGTDGNNGTIVTGYVFRTSTTPAGSCSLLLPVQLLSFSVTHQGEAVYAQWQVANPWSVAYFTLERKTQADHWVPVTSITAQDSLSGYAVTDAFSFTGTAYYRLRITEKSNAQTYSPERQLYRAAGGDFTIYPNPARNQVIIQSAKLQGPIRISDCSGRLITERPLTATRTVLSLPALTPGIYLLQVNGVTKKLMVGNQ